MEALEISERATAARERAALKWHLDKMNAALKDAGNNLKEIRDKKLWRHDYASFDAFCAKELGFTRRRADQLIELKEEKLLLCDLFKEEPEIVEQVEKMKEGASRELGDIPDDKKTEVIRKAATEGKITSGSLKRAKARVIDAETGKPEPEEPKCCPTCKRPL